MRALLVLMALLAACSTIGPLDLRDTPTFAATDLKPRADALAERAKRGEAFIVQVKKGDEVPIKLSLEIPGLVFVPGQNVMRFDRDVFLHIGSGKIHVSPDGQTWAEIGDFKGMARLFGLGHGGFFQVGVGVSAPEGPVISLKMGGK